MDRFIRSQTNDTTNSGIHFKKRKATSSAQQDAVNASSPFKTTRSSRTTQEGVKQKESKQLIGLNIVYIALILFCLSTLIVETRPRTNYIKLVPVRIHLQTAKAHELELLPGIGPKMAQRIIEYRKTHELRTPEDLDGVYGIGELKIKHLRWLVATEDEIQ